MLSTFARGLTALVLITLAACGDSTPPPVAPNPAMPTPASTAPNAPSTSLDAPAATPLPSGFTLSQEGGDCGDDVAVKKKCATGLMCTPAAGGPVSEHAPGKCTKAPKP
jgi:hypothetical protein